MPRENFTLNKALQEDVVAYCEENRTYKSEFFRSLIRKEIARWRAHKAQQQTQQAN